MRGFIHRTADVEDVTIIVTYDSISGGELLFDIIRDGIELQLPVTLDVSGSNAFEAPVD